MNNQVKTEFNLFVDRCIWTYECWQMNQLICEYNIKDSTDVWSRFGSIMRFYVFSQIAKINDPIENRGNKNLSLEYIVKHVVNKDNYTSFYNKFVQDNDEFIKVVKIIRNKVASHNDLKTYKSGKLLTGFSHGLDEKYFKSLLDMIVQGSIELGIDTITEWPDFIEFDVKQFMTKLATAFGA